jgi:hypothetical protein
MGDETRVPIADDLAGESEPSEHVFEVEFRYAGSGDRGGAGEKYCAS